MVLNNVFIHKKIRGIVYCIVQDLIRFDIKLHLPQLFKNNTKCTKNRCS